MYKRMRACVGMQQGFTRQRRVSFESVHPTLLTVTEKALAVSDKSL
jgi:hypothetical protein